MSSNLMWRPARPPKSGSLPKDLKFKISKRLWGTDGSCGDGEATVTESDIPYLEGLADAGISGAAELIELIRKHGEVVLWHQF